MRDTPPDAAVIKAISLAGYENISLTFDWNPEWLDGLHDGSQKFYVHWDLNDDNWTELYAGSKGWVRGLEIFFPEAVNDQSDFRFKFWIDVNENTDKVRIDNVSLTGSLIPGNPVPEPTTMLLFGLGLLGLAGVNRKKQ